jgi:hypothetical protein
VEAGANAFLELGPGCALAEMAASAYPGVAARSVDEFKSLEGACAWLARASEAPAIDRFARSIAHWSLDQGCCGSMASSGCQVWQKCSVVKVLNGCGPCGVSNCI